MNKNKIILLVIFCLVVAAFFLLDLGEYASLEYIKTQQSRIDAYYTSHPAQTSLIFFILYITLITFSLPAAAVMTLVAGAIFGIIWGTVIVSFASSIGSTLAFLLSRYLLHEAFQKKFADKLVKINAGIEKEGAFYLFTIRMVPLFPLFIINVVMGLTPIRTATFYIASQLGMLLGTIVYVNAGMQLAQINALSDIGSPELLISFTLLGLLPLVSKKIISLIRARKMNHLEPDNEKTPEL